MPDIQTSTAIRDTSGETDPEYAPNLLPQSPTLRASSYAEAPPAPPQSPHSARVDKDIWCTPRLRTSAASPPMLSTRSSPATAQSHPSSPHSSEQRNPKH